MTRLETFPLRSLFFFLRLIYHKRLSTARTRERHRADSKGEDL